MPACALLRAGSALYFVLQHTHSQVSAALRCQGVGPPPGGCWWGLPPPWALLGDAGVSQLCLGAVWLRAAVWGQFDQEHQCRAGRWPVRALGDPPCCCEARPSHKMAVGGGGTSCQRAHQSVHTHAHTSAHMYCTRTPLRHSWERTHIHIVVMQAHT